MHKFFIGIILIALLSGCSAIGLAAPAATDTTISTATPLLPSAPPEPTNTPQPACVTDSIPTFTDYATWTRVNPKPIKGHEVFVNIYVNDLAKDVYLSASGETFPVCAMIVKTHLAGEDSDTVTALTVMVKMPAGYDPDHNDWYWGMYDKDGRVAEMSGKVPVCIVCHQPAAAADYVFSQKVMEEINK